jgi:putative heme-binding domain-containing protein
MKCKLGLYNHGGWGGEPESLVGICKTLREKHKADHVGIVYNLHHGHGHIKDFDTALKAMKPYLLCLNLNGMATEGNGPQILPLGAGEHDVQLLKSIRDSGYAGPIGIIGHTQDDVELRLRDNLDGLDWILPQLDGKAAGERPKYRTYLKAKEKTEAKPTPSYDAALVREIVDDAKKHGDARRGALLFGLPTSACLSCHKVGTRGGTVGPDLTKVGFCLKPEEIVESVLWPNRTVKPEFKAIAITTTSGKVLQGILRQETTAEVVLVDLAGKALHIPNKEIDERRDIGSLMPEGLTVAMSVEQRRDLIRYLMELGRTNGLEGLSHEVAKFAFSQEPLIPEQWPNRTQRVNRDRVYDFYTKEAIHFQKQRPLPLLLPEWPDLDGGKYGHWGNQNDTVWKDGRWNETDLGSLQCGVFRTGTLTIPRAVCVRLGDNGEMAACFNPDTLQVEALWKGGFVRFTDNRFGFMDGLKPVGTLLDLPAFTKPTKPFVYHGFYRHGKRVLFYYRLGDVEMLDAPWVKDGRFVREIAPVEKHSLLHLTRGGKAQWPTELTTTGSLGTNRPYAVDTIALPFKNPWNALFFIGGHDFFADGSAALCTMQGDVWHVAGLDASLQNVHWKRMAAGLHHALGLVVVEGSVYVLGRDQITRLVDLNGDGEADFYECVTNAYITSPAGHDFICGLERDKAGNFYTASGNQGLLRISSDGKKVEVLATGFRNPAGLGLLPNGSLTVPCSEGDWTPASMVCEVKPDPSRKLHYGYGGPIDNKPPELPLIYLPRGLDNSSGGQIVVTSDKWGPLNGQLLHFSYGTASHFLVLHDEVDGQSQGAVVPLVGDFLSGVQRGRFNPKDGQLYVTGMSGWGTYSPDDGCFQRVRYTGNPVQLPDQFHVHRNGILLHFTQPLQHEFVENVANHFAQCWNYRYSSGYGSREFSPSHYGTPGHDPVILASAKVLPDGRSLFLEIPDLQPVNQLHLHVGIAKGKACDLFLTVHKLDAPFRDLPHYRDVPRTIGAHPILRDLAVGAKRVPNPWKQPIANARAIQIEAGKNLTFATPSIRVKVGEPIRLTFKNPDVVPHNWVLIKPGTLQQVGNLTNKMLADPEAVTKHYVSASKDVLVYTDIVSGQQSTTVYFRSPITKGVYPFLCTFPGHWMVMNGEMIVED